MKKSLLIYLISAVFLFGLVSCNKTCSHSYDEWVVIKEATCTEEGSRERVCSNCNDKETEVVQATGHAFSEEWSYDETNHWHESTCGHDLKKDEENHNFVNGICSICSIEKFTSGLQYTLNLLKTEYSLTGIGTATDTDIVIPSSYNGLPVTAIGENAFMNCSDITSISIPNSVISIDSNVFSECSSLQYNEYDNALYLGNSDNPYLVLVKEKDKGIRSCEINSQTRIILDSAFYMCFGIASVSIPKSIIYINPSIFSMSEGLLQYNEYDNALYLGNSDNPYLVLVKEKDRDISSCEINSQTKIIPSSSFNACNNLTSITIPNSVTYIGEGAFSYCSTLESIVVESGNLRYISDGNCLIDTKTKTLILGCKSSIIPTNDSVVFIGNSAFEGCEGLTSITIPNSVISIGFLAFDFCINLKNVTIGSSLTSIGEAAFGSCTSITSITIPNRVTSIGYEAFANCSGLESIVVESGNPTYHSDGNCLIDTKTKTLILGCKNSIIPTNDSVTSIDVDAFQGCEGLTSITIPDSITTIKSSAFGNCKDLKSITITNSIKSIAIATFYGCINLESVTIANSVTSIGRNAFTNCSSLTSIIYNGTIEEWQKIDKSSGWDYRTGDYTVTCTDGTVSKDVTETSNA